MPYGSPRFSGSMGLLRLASARAAARSVTAIGPGNHREIAIGPRDWDTGLGDGGWRGGVLLAASLPPWPVATGAWPLGLAGRGLLFLALDGRRPAADGVRDGRRARPLPPGLWWMRDFSVPGFLVAASSWRRRSSPPASPWCRRPRAGGGRWPSRPRWWRSRRCAGHWPFGGLPISGIDLGQVGGPLAPARPDRRAAAARRRWSASAGVALAGLVRRRWRAAGVAAPRCWRWSPARRRGGARRCRRAGRLAVGGRPGRRAPGRAGRRPRPGAGVRAPRARPPPACGRPVDLVLWPEDVVDVEGEVATHARGPAAGRAGRRRCDATLVAGVVQDEPGRPLPQLGGALGAGRDAVRPLRQGPPGAVRRVRPGPRLLRAAGRPVRRPPRRHWSAAAPACSTRRPGKLGVVISYEVFFADRARAAVRAGGRSCSCRPTPRRTGTPRCRPRRWPWPGCGPGDRPVGRAGRAHRLQRGHRPAGPGAPERPRRAEVLQPTSTCAPATPVRGRGPAPWVMRRSPWRHEY